MSCPRATTRELPVFMMDPELVYLGMLLLSCCTSACVPVFVPTGLAHSSANLRAGSGVTNVARSAIGWALCMALPTCSGRSMPARPLHAVQTMLPCRSTALDKPAQANVSAVYLL